MHLRIDHFPKKTKGLYLHSLSVFPELLVTLPSKSEKKEQAGGGGSLHDQNLPKGHSFYCPHTAAQNMYVEQSFVKDLSAGIC